MANIGKSVRIGGFVISLAFLAFVVGMAVTATRVFPYAIFADAAVGLDYVYNYILVRVIEPEDNPFLYVKVEAERGGVVELDSARAQPGLTLFSSGRASAAFLVTLEGDVVHEWAYPFSEVWRYPPHIVRPVKNKSIFWRRTQVFPNGDLLAIYMASGDSPPSYGMIKIDKDSNLIWSYPELVHHDFAVAEDGRIYAVINEIRNSKIEKLERVKKRFGTIAWRKVTYPVLDDGVAELTADGEEIRRVSIIDAFLNSDYANMLAFAQNRRWDAVHLNSVEVITDRFARQHPEFEAGQLLISLKEISTVAVLDMDSERIVWARRGSWREQHDADQLENGNMMVFDNFGHLGKGGPSRVVEFDPITGAEKWAYAGTEEKPLFSSIRSAQQVLPNGNVLITDSNNARIIEVTRDRDIVWELINPQSRGGKRGVLCWAERIAPARLTFLE